jgi:signal transduction histidine kinase
VFSEAVNEDHAGLMSPVLLEGSSQPLYLESTLQELPLYHFQAEVSCLGIQVAQVFEQYPLLPGVILMNSGQFVGMVSRQRLLEYLLRPHGAELFLRMPLKVLHSYSPKCWLTLPKNTSILVAAQQALRRSSELLSDPIIVEHEAAYHLLDARALNLAYWQIRGIETQVRYERMQIQMLQSEKMASLGRLVDGVAHEILDPVSFIWGNLSHVAEYSQSLLALVAAYEQEMTKTSPEIVRLREAIEVDYIKEDLPKTLDSIKTGAERLSKLANSLQTFCHLDEIYPKPANLHECIDGVLLLLKSRISSDIEIVKQYGQLPPVPCFIGQLSQVFINILSRAIEVSLNQAVSDRLSAELKIPNRKSSTAIPSKITIATDICVLEGSSTRWVSIRISDNGTAMSPETCQQLMEAFSSSKLPAKETSLITSYRMITARHGGKFRVYSRLNSAEARTETQATTEFEILLPLT